MSSGKSSAPEENEPIHLSVESPADDDATRAQRDLLGTSIAAREGQDCAGGQLRLVLERLLLQEMRDSPAIEHLARKLGASPRTLQRRLKDAGTSFSDVYEEVRLRLACRLLSQRDSTMVSVAQELGFSDQSAFSRAFKRWTGVSPRRFRRGQLS